MLSGIQTYSRFYAGSRISLIQYYITSATLTVAVHGFIFRTIQTWLLHYYKVGLVLVNPILGFGPARVAHRLALTLAVLRSSDINKQLSVSYHTIPGVNLHTIVVLITGRHHIDQMTV